MPTWAWLLVCFVAFHAGFLLAALLAAAKQAELRARVLLLRTAIEKHMGPQSSPGGISFACCDPVLSKALARTEDDT